MGFPLSFVPTSPNPKADVTRVLLQEWSHDL